MNKTYIHKVRLTETQRNSFKVLKSYNVNISQFIRSAKKEKLDKDWKQIKEKKDNFTYPF